MSDEWQKDLSAVGFEMADLVQRVRTMVLATGALCDRVPEQLTPAVAQARFSVDAAVALIEGAAERLLQMDDEQQAAVLIGAGPVEFHHVAHNHGPNDGPGIGCRETVGPGALVYGDCLTGPCDRWDDQ